MGNKKALITGASEGIGREFAKQLAKEGYTITAVARNEARLKSLLEELPSGAHKYLVADLSKQDGIKKTNEELSTHYELLVNNAGFGVYGKFYETPLKKFQEMLSLNIDALVALSHSFLKVAEKDDALINVASTLAFLPMPNGGVYAATKAFVTSFTESLWFEQKERGIFVMDLCPGATVTEFQVRAGGKTEDIPKAIQQTPEQVVKVAIRALKRRNRPTVISGLPNHLMATVARLIPRKFTVSMMGAMR